MEFFEVIKKRRSTRAFLAKEIEGEKLNKILKASNQAPSAHNFQSYKIYLIKSKNTKDRLAQASFNQDFISQAPVVLVFVSCPAGDETRAGFYSLQDATIACYQAWLAAVDLGLSAVWIGAFDAEEVAKILGLDDFEEPVAILPIGYAGETPEKTPRKSLDELIVNI